MGGIGEIPGVGIYPEPSIQRKLRRRNSKEFLNEMSVQVLKWDSWATQGVRRRSSNDLRQQLKLCVSRYMPASEKLAEKRPSDGRVPIRTPNASGTKPT